MTSAYDQGNIPEITMRHRLRIARESIGLDQDQLADLIGVSRNTIGNMEKGRGKTPPRKLILNAWALACGVPVSWILTGKETPPPNPDGPDGGLLLPRMDSNHQPCDSLHKAFRPRTLSAEAA
jgi:transcriptional regulator with XRE-family HTH domain